MLPLTHALGLGFRFDSIRFTRFLTLTRVDLGLGFQFSSICID
jgi:hypothetical protein